MAAVTIRNKGTHSASMDALTDRQILNRLRKIAELEKIAKDARDQVDAIRAELTGGNVCAVETDRYKFSWAAETREILDTKRLKAERPDIAAEYIKQSTSRVFRYKIFA